MILRLHGDAGLRATIAAHGRRLVEEKFDWDNIHRLIANEVTGLLRQQPRLAA